MRVRLGPSLAGPLALTSLLLAGGCADAPAPQPASQPIRLGDLAPRHNPRPTPTPTEAGVTLAQVAEIALPLDADLTAARRMLERGSIPLPELDLWRANGLFAGVLEAGRLPAFMAALPPAAGGREQRILGAQTFTPLPIAAPLAGRVLRLTLTRSDGREHPVAFAAGRLQFLFRCRRDPAAGDIIELVPHHHYAQVSVVPRLPQEKMLDGDILQDLALHAWLRPGQMLVVGLQLEGLPGLPDEARATQPARDAGPTPARPAAATPAPLPGASPLAPPEAPAPTTQPTPATGPAPINPALVEAIITRPRHLGAALLGAPRPGQPAQTVLLLGALETPAPPRPTTTATAPAR